MMTENLPFFNPDDYPAFRRMIGSDLPDTYDEWLQLHTKEKRELSNVGHSIRVIKIYPDDFARFLSARGQRANFSTLRAFTSEKAARNEY